MDRAVNQGIGVDRYYSIASSMQYLARSGPALALEGTILEPMCGQEFTNSRSIAIIVTARLCRRAAQSRIALCVFDVTKRSVTVVVKRAIRQAAMAKKAPNIAVAPVQNWTNSHEVRPSIAGRRKVVHISSEGVTSPLSHGHSLQSSLVHQLCDAVFVAALELNEGQTHFPLGRINEGKHLREFVYVPEEQDGHACERFCV